MIWSLLGAIAAAICFGVATVMQAVAARSAPASDHVDPRLLIRLLGQVPFVIGVVLDLAGFIAELAALRSLPLFVVQAVVAANLAVTAVVGARVLRITISPREWGAVIAVCAGLALLGLAAGHENPSKVSIDFRLGLLGCVAFVAVAGVIAGRLPGRWRSATLGIVAGLGFGLVAIGARVVVNLAPLDLLRDPATYVVAGGGIIAFLFYATALQRGSVTTTTAGLVIAETVVPAVVGVAELGDHTRHGFAWVAIIGFVVAVAGALALSRFGEPAPESVDEDSAAPAPMS
jgi:drug/metabolite transporter (DMT)-like permease